MIADKRRPIPLSRFAVSLDTCDPDLKPILSRVFSLYLASIVEKNLAWFVISGLVPRYC